MKTEKECFLSKFSTLHFGDIHFVSFYRRVVRAVFASSSFSPLGLSQCFLSKHVLSPHVLRTYIKEQCNIYEYISSSIL